MISAKKRAKEINDRAKDEDEEDQMTIIACHAAEKILMKQRRLNTIETENENITADDTTNEKNFDVVIVFNAVSEAEKTKKDVDFVTAFDAINEEKQISLTNLL